jgi:hypothetical protein
MNRKKSGPPMEFRVAVTGDRRMVENLILEVRAIAERCGLQIPNVEVINQSDTSPKTATKKARSRRKAKS